MLNTNRRQRDSSELSRPPPIGLPRTAARLDAGRVVRKSDHPAAAEPELIFWCPWRDLNPHALASNRF